MWQVEGGLDGHSVGAKVLGVGKGMAQGTGSLVRNTAGGVTQFLASATGTLSTAAAQMAMDDDYLKKRNNAKFKQVQRQIRARDSCTLCVVHGTFWGGRSISVWPSLARTSWVGMRAQHVVLDDVQVVWLRAFTH